LKILGQIHIGYDNKIVTKTMHFLFSFFFTSDDKIIRYYVSTIYYWIVT